MKRIPSIFLVGLLLLTASPAFAQDPFSLELGIGLKGGLSGSAVSGVPEDEVWNIGGVDAIYDPNVFPMFGMGGGVGLTFEARAMDLIGLESGVYLSYDNGDGFQDINNPLGQKMFTVNQEQRTTALHVPLLLKVVVPGAFVRPAFGLGVEFVMQQDSTFEHDPEAYSNPHTIETSNYTLGMFTAGLEFNVGVVRIPLELRLGYNLGFGAKASDRVRSEGNNPATATIIYDGEYQGHFGLFTGIVYDYELLF
jgi:hypothetical protein